MKKNALLFMMFAMVTTLYAQQEPDEQYVAAPGPMALTGYLSRQATG